MSTIIANLLENEPAQIPNDFDNILDLFRLLFESQVEVSKKRLVAKTLSRHCLDGPVDAQEKFLRAFHFNPFLAYLLPLFKNRLGNLVSMFSPRFAAETLLVMKLYPETSINHQLHLLIQGDVQTLKSSRVDLNPLFDLVEKYCEYSLFSLSDLPYFKIINPHKSIHDTSKTSEFLIAPRDIQIDFSAWASCAKHVYSISPNPTKYTHISLFRYIASINWIVALLEENCGWELLSSKDIPEFGPLCLLNIILKSCAEFASPLLKLIIPAICKLVPPEYSRFIHAVASVYHVCVPECTGVVQPCLESFYVSSQDIFVDTTYTEVLGLVQNAEYITLDCEWDPDLDVGIKNSAAVLQVAIKSGNAVSAHIFELKQTDEIIVDCILHSSCVKIGFGFSQDLSRLKLCYNDLNVSNLNIVDLSTFIKIPGKKRVSLNDVARHYLNVSVDKRARLGIWSSWPLTEAQVKYAANDVLVLADIWEIAKESVPKKSKKRKLSKTIK